ncbi:MAG: hypothetical protein KGP13_00080 [Burkholderiales bacterium]|jgi:hypothetical protein|nr:hypothetical protein [Burkholderiales bacterium]
MALLGPEGVNQVARVVPVTLDQRQVFVEAPVAKQLGLHDGQVVQAVVTLHQDQLKLAIREQVFNLPLSPYIKEGDLAQLRAQLLPNGKWVLQLLHTGTYAGLQTSQAAQAALAAQTAQTAAQALMPSRFNALLVQPEGFANWVNLLRPGVLDALLPAGVASEIKERVKAQRLTMANLQPQGLRRFVLKHAASTEANLAQAQEIEDDAKVLLRLLMSERQRMGAIEEGETQDLLRHALDEVEAAQLQTVKDWRQGDLNLSFVIPFTDADPLEMHFEKKGDKPGHPKNPLVVNMHTNSRVLGEVWLKTSISAPTNVNLTMWALRADIANQARENASELTYELESAGLVLGSFQVYNAPRPDAKQKREVPKHGVLIDTEV